MKRLFLDCSWLSQNPEMNTGIQRVVRRITENFMEIGHDHGFDPMMVSLEDGRISQIFEQDIYHNVPENRKDSKGPGLRHKISTYLREVYRQGKLFTVALLPLPPVRRFLLTGKDVTFSADWFLHSLLIRPVKQISNRKTTQELLETNPIIDSVSKDDILLLIDSSWDMKIWSAVHEFHKRGALVIAIIYDLIPVIHPQFCDPFLIPSFTEWLHDSVKVVDGYIAISKTVEDELRNYLKVYAGQDTASRLMFGYFHLGGDFTNEQINKSQTRQELKNAFSRPSYLIVSTLEPRKNHAYLIDAFDILWQNNIDVNLCIVGRVGWKVEFLLDRIRTHREFGKRLFLWHDISDHELAFCYSHAKALVFPSYVEGFGLPIIESLSKGLPVLASDIPIHREIGKENIGYFDLSDPSDLARQIQEIETNGIPAYLKVPEDYSWLTWRDSAHMLLEKIKDFSNNHKTR